MPMPGPMTPRAARPAPMCSIRVLPPAARASRPGRAAVVGGCRALLVRPARPRPAAGRGASAASAAGVLLLVVMALDGEER